MKKKLAWACAIGTALFLLYFVGSGFIKNPSVYINAYVISQDGREITLEADATSSAGYLRQAVVHQQFGGHLYIDFYNAFGGLNGQIGAKTSFTLPLAEDTTTIAVYRNKSCYQEVLRKNPDGLWQPVGQ